MASAAAAAALFALGLALLQEESGRPFTVHHGRPARPHALVAELAGGWSGGILRADGVPLEESR